MEGKTRIIKQLVANFNRIYIYTVYICTIWKICSDIHLYEQRATIEVIIEIHLKIDSNKNCQL